MTASRGEARVRGPFLRPLELVGVLLVVAALLVVLFPRVDYADPRHLARPDDLSIAYLRLLLRAQPKHAAARVLLAQQELQLGKWDEAQATLAPLLTRNDAFGTRAQLTAIEILRRQLAALPAADPRRPGLQQNALGAARKIAPRLQERADLEALAAFLLELGGPGDAAGLYDRLARLSDAEPAGAAAAAALAGRWHLAAGRQQASALSYLHAARVAPDPAQRMAFGLRALDSLEAGDLGRAALDTAERLAQTFPTSLAVLERAGKVALGAGALAEARAFADRRLALSDDDRTRALVLDLAMQAGDVASAFKHAKAQAARRPDDEGAWQTLAQTSEWSGHPEEALRAWVHLARRGSPAARERALVLAKQLADSDLVIEMLELKVRAVQPHKPRAGLMRPRARRLTGACGGATAAAPKGPGVELEDLLLLANALETRGDPRRAAATMEGFTDAFSGRPEFWDALGGFLERAGDLDRALQAERRVTELTGDSADRAVDEAELLWRTHRPSEALDRLLASRDRARDSDEEYFALLADLGWRLERNRPALDAYRVLHNTGKATLEGERRLVRLLTEERQWDEGLAAVQSALSRFDDPELFAAGLGIATQAERWSGLRALVAVAARHESVYTGDESYFVAQGLLAAQDKTYGAAETQFRRALAADPSSMDAHRSWLQVAVDAQNAAMARRALAGWAQTAASDPESWDVLADAYDLLGQTVIARRFEAMAVAAKLRTPDAPDADEASPDEALTEQLNDALAEAVDKDDRKTVDTLLREHGTRLTLANRVSGARALGRDDDAWRMLVQNRSRLWSGDADAAELQESYAELRDDHLAGAWAEAGVESIGNLALRTAVARAAMRLEPLELGLEAGVDKLVSESPWYIARGDDELHVGAAAAFRRGPSETVARAGVHALPTGAVPYAGLEQFLASDAWNLWARLVGAYNELPNNSALSRAATLRRRAEIEAGWRFLSHGELGLAGGESAYVTRGGVAIGHGATGRAELAARAAASSLLTLRLRIDAETDRMKQRAMVPSLLPFVPPADDAPDLLPRAYTTSGIGLTALFDSAEPGDGRGAPRTVRGSLDVWAGRLWPQRKFTYAFEGNLGYVLARGHEVGVAGFFYLDHAGEEGQRFAGATVKYVMRWLQ